MKKIGITKLGVGITLLSCLFWLFDFIPVVSVFTSIVYWLIWIGIFLNKYPGVLKNPKIAMIVGICALMGMIPFINWLPWDVVATYISFKIANKENKEDDDEESEQGEEVEQEEPIRPPLQQGQMRYNTHIYDTDEEEDDESGEENQRIAA